MKKHPYQRLKERRPFFFTTGLVAALAISLLAFEFKSFSIVEVIPEYADIEEVEDELIPITTRKKKVPKLPEPKPKRLKPQPLPIPAPEPTPNPVLEPEPDPFIDDIDSFMVDLPIEKYVDEEEIFLIPQKQAEYIGGQKELFRYMKKIKLPEAFKELGSSGKLVATWVIEKDGSVSNVEVLRGLGYGLDDAVVKHIESMPEWIPAMQGDRNVRQRFHLPIQYSLK